MQIGVDIDGEADDDYSGRSVSLSGDGMTVAIGGYGPGHVRVFAQYKRVDRRLLRL